MNHVCSDQTRHSRVSRAFLTHSFSISLACGCFSFLALSRSKNRSLSRPSASPSLSEIIVWCWNGSSFLSFSASCRKRMKGEQVNFDICQWSKWQSVIYCLFFLTTARSSSARKTSFSTWSAFFCIWAISKARLLVLVLWGLGQRGTFLIFNLILLFVLVQDPWPNIKQTSGHHKCLYS